MTPLTNKVTTLTDVIVEITLESKLDPDSVIEINFPHALGLPEGNTQLEIIFRDQWKNYTLTGVVTNVSNTI
jgi:hypothetical protein